MACAFAYAFHKAKQSVYARVGNDAKATAHANRARRYVANFGARRYEANFGALPGAMCAACRAIETTESGVKLIELRSRGPPAQYLCLRCYRERKAEPNQENVIEQRKDEARARAANNDSTTLDLQLLRKSRSSLAPNETDEATKEAQSGTVARHNRELLAKQEKERRKPQVDANLAKFNALPQKAADQTLQQKLAQKPVVTSPLAPLPANMLRGMPKLKT